MTASGRAPLAPALDLGEYRRQRYERARARLRWRYENGLTIPRI